MTGHVWRTLGALLVLPALAVAGYAPRLPHDECAGAVPIASLSYSDRVDIENFFSDIDDVNFPCAGNPGDERPAWYRYTSGTGEQATVDVSASDLQAAG